MTEPDQFVVDQWLADHRVTLPTFPLEIRRQMLTHLTAALKTMLHEVRQEIERMP